MRALATPPGYLSLRDARDELIRRMHEGVPPHKKVKRRPRKKYDVPDSTPQKAAVSALRKAILSGDLALYAVFWTSREPQKLTLEICEAAVKPNDGTVLTFVYIDRVRSPPWDLSWPETKKLMRDPLCLSENDFRDWLRKEERKKAWPCHANGVHPVKTQGRPRIIDEVIEVLNEGMKSGELKSSMLLKQIHEFVQNARVTLKKVSAETVRRACHELEIEFARSRLSDR